MLTFLLSGPMRRLLPYALGALAIAGLWFWVDGRGYGRAVNDIQDQINKSEKATREAIDAAPVFNTNDPRVLSELCAHAGFTDCHTVQ